MKRGTILFSVIGFVLLIQLFRINKTNPAIIPAQDFATLVNMPVDKLAILKAACYDCHSNESIFPWYADLAPLSWRVSDHIKNARSHLNFSEWGTYSARRQQHRLEDIQDAFSNNWMPLWDYKLAHKASRLSAQQRTEMAGWFKTLE